jgi:hypothetical protein
MIYVVLLLLSFFLVVFSVRCINVEWVEAPRRPLAASDSRTDAPTHSKEREREREREGERERDRGRERERERETETERERALWRRRVRSHC